MYFRKKIAGMMLLSFGITACWTMPLQAESISELQNKQSSVKESITKKQSELTNNTAKKNDTLNKLKSINDNINSTEEKIASFSTQISDQETSIEETNKKIAETESKLQQSKQALNDRVVSIYKDGKMNYLEVLFQAKDFSDFLTKFEYLSYITKSDKALIDSVKETKALLDSQKASLEQQLQNLSALKSQEESVKKLLVAQQSQQQTIYKDLESNEEALRANIAAMQAASESIASQIMELQAAAAAASAASQSAVFNSQTVVYSGTGGWPAPASHVITSPYGARAYPLSGIYDFHLGLDIGAGYGTPVVSHKPGTVIIADYHWSYGNYVVVDHGNGISTLYAHMSAISTGVGQHVEQGQQLGLVGSTGSSTGAHLHFEVRINGSTVNPAPYLGI